MKKVNYETQVEQLLKALTLEEKVTMLHGTGLFRSGAVDRLGIPSVEMSDGPMGVRNEFPNASWIPMGNSDDYVTYLPSNSALASTWNVECAYESGQILGAEARGRGKDVILAPGINIKRDPLCGRNFEYLSEDPYMVEAFAVPIIQGIQESDVAACVKHFAANSQETDRLMVDTIVDERTLREIYLPGFLAAIKKGNTYSLMNAYNKLNGTHCSEDIKLLNELLRDEWGYDGTVISDWGSVHTTKGCAEGSLDIEMSVTYNFDEYFFADALLNAVKKGEVLEEDVDKKVRNILRMMYRLKMIGKEASQRKTGTYNKQSHREGVYKVAQESIILLKNENNLLPITEERVAKTYDGTNKELVAGPRKRKVAVIGCNAEQIHSCGGGSAEIKALYEISPLMGIKTHLGGNVEVVYAKGYFIPGTKDTNEVNWQEASLERQVMNQKDVDETPEQKAQRLEIEIQRKALREEAVQIAQSADEVIYVGGLNHDYDTEGRDRDDMKLPYGQDELIEAILEVQPNAVITIVAGSPVEMPWREKAKAIVWCYFAGMETGNAIADVLFGQVNPSGKTAETFPVSYEDTVTFKNGEFGKEERVEYKEGIFIGYRYYEKENIKPAFAFGHGLSYTTFDITDLKVQKLGEIDSKDLDKEILEVKVQVTNTGDVAGSEVAQCYIGDCQCSVERPVKELKAFQKVFLQPNETQEVKLVLPLQAFCFFDVDKKAFVAEAGAFNVQIGNASDHIFLQEEIVL